MPAPWKVNVRFVYNVCNDVEAIRAFYTEVLGFEQGAFMNEDGFGFVGYRCEGVELMFFRSDKPLPMPDGFAWQPGDGEGTLPVTSIGVHVEEGSFAATVQRIRSGGGRTLTPEADSYQPTAGSSITSWPS